MGLKQRTFNFLNPHFKTHDAQLEKSNNHHQAQRLRRTQHHLFCTDWVERTNLLDRLQIIFDCEHELRLVVQREAGFLEQARLLEEEIVGESSDNEDEEYGRRKIKALRTLIADLHTPQYETAAQALHSNDHLLHNGPVLRSPIEPPKPAGPSDPIPSSTMCPDAGMLCAGVRMLRETAEYD